MSCSVSLASLFQLAILQRIIQFRIPELHQNYFVANVLVTHL